MAERVSVIDAIASYGESPLCKVEIESEIRVDLESYRCWLPSEGSIGKSDEQENSILLRCPGLARILFLRPDTDERQTWLCRVTGILVCSYVTPFPVIMSPVLGVEFVDGVSNGVMDMAKVGKFPEESVDSIRGGVEAEYTTLERSEASLKKFLDEFEMW